MEDFNTLVFQHTLILPLLESEPAKRHRIGQVTIFPDAPAAIARTASGEPWPGPEVCTSSRAREHAEDRTGDPGRDPVAPRPQRDSRQRQGRRVGKMAVSEPDEHGWSGLGSRTSTGDGIACSPQAANLRKEAAARGSDWQSTSIATSSALSRTRSGRTR